MIRVLAWRCLASWAEGGCGRGCPLPPRGSGGFNTGKFFGYFT